MGYSYLRRAFIAMALSLPLSAVHAEQFPSRPIRLIVPYAPGSGTDLIARSLASAVTAETGAAVIVDNRAGAEGFLGSQAAAKAEPDGYTLLMAGSSTQVVNVHMYRHLPYDPIKDFVPVIPVAKTQMLLTVNSKSTFNNTADLIHAAKASPGKVTFGSGSATTRLAGEYFAQQSGIKILHVPYRSPSLAINDLMGEQVDMVFIDYPTIAGHLKGGRLRALAVTGRARMQAQHSVPTLREAGLKDYDLYAWYGIWAPAGIARERLSVLHELLARGIASAPTKAFLENSAMERLPAMSSDEFRRFQVDETEKVGRVIRAAKIEPQ